MEACSDKAAYVTAKASELFLRNVAASAADAASSAGREEISYDDVAQAVGNIRGAAVLQGIVPRRYPAGTVRHALAQAGVGTPGPSTGARTSSVYAPSPAGVAEEPQGGPSDP